MLSLRSNGNWSAYRKISGNKFCHKNRNMAAFTLAEVLITLGIIGVIAALTLPTVINNIGEKSNIVALKKFYAEFYNATNMIKTEYEDPSYWKLKDNNAQSADWVMDRYKEHLSIQRICGAGDSSCMNFPIYSYNTKQAVITQSQYESWSLRGFILNNGMTGFFDVNNGNFSVFVDVNGFKNPNTLGIDVFAWAVNNQGKIVRYTDPSLNYSGNDNPEYNYAFEIMENGWEKKY